MFRLKGLFPLLFILALAFSCLENPDCVRRNNNFLDIAFKNIRTGGNLGVRLDSIILTGSDSVFYRAMTSNVSRVEIPLNYLSDSTEISFKIRNDSVRTMVVTYTVRTQYVAEDCGERYILDNLAVKSSEFDSVRLLNVTPGKLSDAANMEIYR